MIKRLFIIMLAGNMAAVLAMYSTGKLEIPRAFAQNRMDMTKQQQLRLELIEDIQKKQEELKTKEEELDRREERIKSLETELDKKIAELKRLQARLEELIKMRDDVEDKNIAALSKTYASMAPEDAAERLKNMDRRIALKIISQIKAKQASRIFSNMDAKTATEMTEQLAKRKLE